MDNRIGYLDFLRGIAILTVVMGHIIQYNLIGESATSCFNFIYSFHMGFFFFISGCAASLSSKKNTWNSFLVFVRKKSRQLLLPFIIWGVFIPVIFRDLCLNDTPSRFILIFRNPDRSAWFLLFLFCIQIIFFICCATTSKAKHKYTRVLTLLLSAPVIVAILYLKKKLIGSDFTWVIPEYFLLFVLGYIAQASDSLKKFSIVVPLVGTIVFVFVVPLFDFSESGSTMMRLIKLLASTAFSVTSYTIVRYYYDVFYTKATIIINYLGTHSLELYVTQYCIIQICISPWLFVSNVNAIPLFVCVLIVSVPTSFIIIGISSVLKLIPGMQLLLYGK